MGMGLCSTALVFHRYGAIRCVAPAGGGPDARFGDEETARTAAPLSQAGAAAGLGCERALLLYAYIFTVYVHLLSCVSECPS
jgi:hypothetical protein